MSADFLSAFVAAVVRAAQPLGVVSTPALPFDLFDALPRQTRIDILLLFSTSEVRQTFCSLNRKYRRIYCGDMALADEIPDSQVVYEHWQLRLERDFGVSRNPDLCRGNEPLERELVADALASIVPNKNRLNSYLASAYEELYQAMSKLGQRTVAGATLLAYRDHIVFLVRRERRPGPIVSSESTVFLATSLDVAKAIMRNTALITGYDLFTSPSDDEAFYVVPTKSRTGAYICGDNQRKEVRVIRFTEKTIDVSVAVRSRAYTTPGVYVDPFDDTSAYALVTDISDAQDLAVLRTFYRFKSPPLTTSSIQVRKDLPVTIVTQTPGADIHNAPVDLSFDTFSVRLTDEIMTITSANGTKVDLELPRFADAPINTDLDAPKFAPSNISVVSYGPGTNMRIVLQHTFVRYTRYIGLLLWIDFEPNSARPSQATYWTYRLPFQVHLINATIEDGRVYHAQLRKHGTQYARPPYVSAQIDLETNTIQVGVTEKNLGNMAVALQKTAPRLQPLPADAPAWSREIEFAPGQRLQIGTKPPAK
jgi:hypothetical protein